MMTLCVKRDLQFDHRKIYFYIAIAMVLKINYIEEKCFSNGLKHHKIYVKEQYNPLLNYSDRLLLEEFF